MFMLRSFMLSNGLQWQVKSYIDCHSTNVIYFLSCNLCKGEKTYIGKTVGKPIKGFKGRMNQHISESSDGNSSCRFPQHIYECGIKNGNFEETYFKIFIMLSLKSPDRLEVLESTFHKRGYAVLNRIN